MIVAILPSSKRNHLLFYLSLWLNSLSIVFAQFHFNNPFTTEKTNIPTSCKGPNGQPSLCVPPSRCNQLSALLKNLQKPISGDVAKYIKDSFVCKNEFNGEAKNEVCCPLDGIKTRSNVFENKEKKCNIQGGAEGGCVIYSQCRPLLELLSNLQQPLPPEIPKLMQSSILCGRGDVNGRGLPKVCCPSEAINLSDEEKFSRHPNRDLLAAECPIVQIETKIVGGEEAPIGRYPWLALLGYNRNQNTGNTSWECGGALIGDQFVLTAAHCINDDLKTVRLGEHKVSHKGKDCSPRNRFDCNLGHQDFEIENITVHPDYNFRTIKNDIAIIQLNQKVTPNLFIKPICLPYDADQKSDYQKFEEPVYVAGWGVTGPRKGTFGSSFKGGPLADALQHLRMLIFDRKKCEKLLSQKNYSLEESQLCVGGKAGHDSCFGDSGSALMTQHLEDKKNFQTWKLIGVVSFGISGRKCGVAGHPGVYTRVRHHIPWILDNVGHNQINHRSNIQSRFRDRLFFG